MEKLLNTSEAGKNISSQLTKIHKGNLTNLKKIGTELKKEEEEIIKQKNIMNKDELEKKLISLRKKASDYQKNRKEKNNELSKKRLALTSKLINLIKPILADYATKNSISIIFQKKNIIIGKTELDITNDILVIINEKHKKINLE